MSSALEKQCTLLIAYERGIPIRAKLGLAGRRGSAGGKLDAGLLASAGASGSGSAAGPGTMPGVPGALAGATGASGLTGTTTSSSSGFSLAALSGRGLGGGGTLAKVERLVGGVLAAAAEAAGAAAAATAAAGYDSAGESSDGEEGLVESVLGLGASRFRKLAAQGAVWSVTDLKQGLESTDVLDKIITLRTLILMHLKGEIPAQQQGGLLMAVIRFILPHEDNQLRKLCLIFLEVVDKTDASGKMLPEMILVCNMIRNELIHPNEYTRGAALRFCCKLNEAELLEPLVPAIRQCLEHRHSYVRRNALLAILSVYRQFEFLVPDAPDLVAKFLDTETDVACRRNAFLMLMNADLDRAVAFLNEHLAQLLAWGDTMQLVVLELIRRVCRQRPPEKGRYIKVIFTLLQSPSAAVAFEAAGTLVKLSAAPTAIRAAASAYCALLVSQSDNNVKLILLDQLCELRRQHLQIIQEFLMEILRALTVPNMDIRRKVLEMTMDMVTSRNVDEVVAVLRREVSRTRSHGGGGGGAEADDGDAATIAEYRQLLIRAIHRAVIHYPEVASKVIGTLSDFLGDAAGQAGPDVVSFVREVSELYPAMRQEVLARLLEALPMIRSPRVFRGALWTLGEYCADAEEVLQAFEAISVQVGSLPLQVAPTANGAVTDAAEGAAAGATTAADSASVPPFQRGMSAAFTAETHANGTAIAGAASAPPATRKSASHKPRILPDGTYATESALDQPIGGDNQGPNGGYRPLLDPWGSALRGLLLSGDYFVGVSVASSLTKLALRAWELGQAALSAPLLRRMLAHAILFGTSLLNYGQHAAEAPARIDADSAERLTTCIRVLLQCPHDAVMDAAARQWLASSRHAFAEMLQEMRRKEQALASERAKQDHVPPDAFVEFRLLHAKRTAASLSAQAASGMVATTTTAGTTEWVGDDDVDVDDDVELAARGGTHERPHLSDFSLQRLHQLSGLADPIYVEAHVAVHQFDIMLDMFIANQTDHTLQNIQLELSTLGDLKLCERPSAFVLGPRQSRSLRAAIKVSSTDTGVIFGNLVYDVAGTAASTAAFGAAGGSGCVISLSEIHLDVMDYIRPAVVSDARFRSMWEEFEWENKVAISTQMDDLEQLLQLIADTLHMRCLTPYRGANRSGFLAANLYACSIFGEDALANVSATRSAESPAGCVSGFVRIRSKTQGIALSLGDRVGQQQQQQMQMQMQGATVSGRV